MTLYPASKFRPFAPVQARTTLLQAVYAGLVDLVVSPEHSESRVVIPSLEEFSLVLLPEHGESRTLAEAGEVLLALLPEHSESRTLVLAGETLVNLDVTAELSFSLVMLAENVFSLVPEAVSRMTSLDEFFKAYSAILYKDSFTAILMPTHPRMTELSR